MAKTEEVWTQLATRIPKELHRRLKLHCVTHHTSVMDFVTETCSPWMASSKACGSRSARRM